MERFRTRVGTGVMVPEVLSQQSTSDVYVIVYVRVLKSVTKSDIVFPLFVELSSDLNFYVIRGEWTIPVQGSGGHVRISVLIIV